MNKSVNTPEQNEYQGPTKKDNKAYKKNPAQEQLIGIRHGGSPCFRSETVIKVALKRRDLFQMSRKPNIPEPDPAERFQ
jgi:hypothetical protein